MHPALVQCHACGAGVSSQARACPHCGQPSRYFIPWYKSPLGVVGIVLVGLLLLSVISAVVMGYAVHEATKPAYPPYQP